MSPNKIDFVPLISNKLIINIIFSVYKTPLTLKLYILIIYINPLYIRIVITVIIRLITYYNYKNKLIALLIIKYIYIAVFSLYKSVRARRDFKVLRSKVSSTYEYR